MAQALAQDVSLQGTVLAEWTETADKVGFVPAASIGSTFGPTGLAPPYPLPV